MRRPSFPSKEAAGGLALMAAAALALAVANGPAAPAYFRLLDRAIGPLTARHWIDDGLMAVFFLLVGLEMKRELVGGRLSRPADRMLPILAATGGMAVPTLVYLALAGGTAGQARGWAIPAATDIAFAVGVLALAGRRLPPSLALFLSTVAIVDDMGAVAIIALFYTDRLDPAALAAAAAILALMGALGRRQVLVLWPYPALAAALWVAVLLSGIHPTVAGVLAALTIPARGREGRRSPLKRLEHALEPWVAFAIVPLFGFANAGLSFAGIGRETLFAPVTHGIALGLFVGKQAGVLGAVRLATALRLAPLPEGADWLQLWGVTLLCGIGFTMSLFIGALAFADPARAAEVKLGVLGGSLLSAVAGFAVLRLARPRPTASPSAPARS